MGFCDRRMCFELFIKPLAKPTHFERIEYETTERFFFISQIQEEETPSCDFEKSNALDVHGCNCSPLNGQSKLRSEQGL